MARDAVSRRLAVLCALVLVGTPHTVVASVDAATVDAEGAPGPAGATVRPFLTIDPTCKGYVFDRERLEEDVMLELGDFVPRELTLDVRCTEDLHAHVSERRGDALLEQTLDLSSLPPSSWHRVLVLSFVEGATALHARSPASPSETEVADEPKSGAGAAAQAKAVAPKKVPPAPLTSPANERSTFEPMDSGDDRDSRTLAINEVWMLGGGGARLTEQGALVGATLGVRYRPLYAGVTVLFGESSGASLSTAFIAWSLTRATKDRWSPLIAPRLSAGMLSRAGAMKGSGSYYSSYFDAGLWLGATMRFAEQWSLSAALDGGYGLPTTVSGTGGTTQAGGGFIGAALMFGARP